MPFVDAAASQLRAAAIKVNGVGAKIKNKKEKPAKRGDA